jgi:hypothetical protein
MWFARHEVSQQNKTWTTPLILTWLYGVFIFVPVGFTFVVKYPAWALVYLIPESSITPVMNVVLLLLYFLGLAVGSICAQSLLQLKRFHDFWISAGLGILWLACTFIFTWHAYNYLGTYEQYHSGMAIPIQSSPEFMTFLNAAGFLWSVPALALAFYFSKRGKKFKAF